MSEFDQRLQSVWDDLRSWMESEERRVKEEIASYPTPIAGCDQQFNHLLELRSELPAEKRRLMEAEREAIQSDFPRRVLEEYLDRSSLIDADRQRAMADLLSD